MENIIRVRVWDKEKELMYYDMPLHLMIRHYARLNHINDIFKLKDYVFMRFTGFLDQNNRKIFEYDIIEQIGIPYLVKWNKEQGYFETDEITGLDTITLNEFLKRNPSEVVGNSYQPPRWLKIKAN
ncbi:YopX family protein [Natranaerofaba carboxydovora]|uniref:YopX family protein n=1 Tax=Natranaerofaba carboxydovora TaxID=2742683 RepID=UPI001F13AE7C|nr:YopX family protein [Natranaerofaba carboxydovora]UMZ72917.1 YopX protein [Natranaerofaba carboxydovora]